MFASSWRSPRRRSRASAACPARGCSSSSATRFRCRSRISLQLLLLALASRPQLLDRRHRRAPAHGPRVEATAPPRRDRRSRGACRWIVSDGTAGRRCRSDSSSSSSVRTSASRAYALSGFARCDGSSQRAVTGTSSSCRRSAPLPYSDRRPSSATRGMESAACARQARDRSWKTKPWDRNRASRRWATRCSRCTWTTSSVSTPGVFEDDRTDRRLAAPLGKLLIALARCAKRVERRRPARVGLARADRAPGTARRPVPSRPIGDERLGAQELQRAREGFAEVILFEAGPGPRLLEQRAAAARSAARGRPRRSRAASNSSSATCLRCASRSASSISSTSLSTSPCRMPDRVSRRSMSSSMTFERLPSSRLIVSVLRTSTSRTRSSARCGRTK